MPSPLDQADLRQRVQACIDGELVHQREVLAEIGPDVDDLPDAIGLLLTGGKRLRAAFLYQGHRAAGRPDSDAAVRLATSMEFFQGAALIHDDVMTTATPAEVCRPRTARSPATTPGGAGPGMPTASGWPGRFSPATSA